MFDTTQLRPQLRDFRSAVLLICAMLVSACGTQGQFSGNTLHAVALIGTTAKTGLKAPVNQLRMSSELSSRLAARTGGTIIPPPSVRKIIGAGPHDEMMAFYARHGSFAAYQVQRLMAANLPATQLLATRLESDVVERLPLQRRNMVSAAGLLLADREQRIHTTRRVTQLSATILDLRTGRVVWTRKYRVSPETSNTSNHRIGESFSTSVAAAVANTLVNGMTVTSHPEPVPLIDAVHALLQEVANNVPVR